MKYENIRVYNQKEDLFKDPWKEEALMEKIKELHKRVSILKGEISDTN